jgi:hypothetical protein
VSATSHTPAPALSAAVVLLVLALALLLLVLVLLLDCCDSALITFPSVMRDLLIEAVSRSFDACQCVYVFVCACMRNSRMH